VKKIQLLGYFAYSDEDQELEGRIITAEEREKECYGQKTTGQLAK